MTTTEQVCAVIERETGQPVTVATALDSLEVDSLEFADLMLSISGECGKDIPTEKWDNLKTVFDIVTELA